MSESRFRPSPPTFDAKLIAARDRRYEISKIHEGEIKTITASLGVTQEQWDDIKPEYRAAITEHFTNVMADLYGKHIPLDRAEEIGEQKRAAAIEAYNTALQQLEAFCSIENITDIIQKARSINEFSFVFNNALTDLVNSLAPLLAPYAPRRTLEQFAYDIIDEIQAGVQPSEAGVDVDTENYKNLRNGAAFQNLYAKMVQPINEFSQLNKEVLRHHDWIHVAEEIADGEESITLHTMDQRKRYVDPNMYIHELFASLFLPSVGFRSDQNLAMGLQNGEWRLHVASMLDKAVEEDSMANQHLHPAIIRSQKDRAKLLKEPMTGRTPNYRQWEYEQIIKNMAIEQAIRVVPNCTRQEIEALRDAFDEMTNAQRPERYKHFAKRVFALEYTNNPYLFVEEFLRLIGALPAGASVLDSSESQ